MPKDYERAKIELQTTTGEIQPDITPPPTMPFITPQDYLLNPIALVSQEALNQQPEAQQQLQQQPMINQEGIIQPQIVQPMETGYIETGQVQPMQTQPQTQQMPEGTYSPLPPGYLEQLDKEQGKEEQQAFAPQIQPEDDIQDMLIKLRDESEYGLTDDIEKEAIKTQADNIAIGTIKHLWKGLTGGIKGIAEYLLVPEGSGKIVNQMKEDSQKIKKVIIESAKKGLVYTPKGRKLLTSIITPYFIEIEKTLAKHGYKIGRDLIVELIPALLRTVGRATLIAENIYKTAKGDQSLEELRDKWYKSLDNIVPIILDALVVFSLLKGPKIRVKGKTVKPTETAAEGVKIKTPEDIEGIVREKGTIKQSVEAEINRIKQEIKTKKAPEEIKKQAEEIRNLETLEKNPELKQHIEELQNIKNEIKNTQKEFKDIVKQKRRAKDILEQKPEKIDKDIADVSEKISKVEDMYKKLQEEKARYEKLKRTDLLKKKNQEIRRTGIKLSNLKTRFEKLKDMRNKIEETTKGKVDEGTIRKISEDIKKQQNVIKEIGKEVKKSKEKYKKIENEIIRKENVKETAKKEKTKKQITKEIEKLKKEREEVGNEVDNNLKKLKDETKILRDLEKQKEGAKPKGILERYYDTYTKLKDLKAREKDIINKIKEVQKKIETEKGRVREKYKGTKGEKLRKIKQLNKVLKDLKKLEKKEPKIKKFIEKVRKNKKMTEEQKIKRIEEMARRQLPKSIRDYIAEKKRIKEEMMGKREPAKETPKEQVKEKIKEPPKEKIPKDEQQNLKTEERMKQSEKEIKEAKDNVKKAKEKISEPEEVLYKKLGEPEIEQYGDKKYKIFREATDTAYKTDKEFGKFVDRLNKGDISLPGIWKQFWNFKSKGILKKYIIENIRTNKFWGKMRTSFEFLYDDLNLPAIATMFDMANNKGHYMLYKIKTYVDKNIDNMFKKYKIKKERFFEDYEKGKYDNVIEKVVKREHVDLRKLTPEERIAYYTISFTEFFADILELRRKTGEHGRPLYRKRYLPHVIIRDIIKKIKEKRGKLTSDEVSLLKGIYNKRFKNPYEIPRWKDLEHYKDPVNALKLYGDIAVKKFMHDIHKGGLDTIYFTLKQMIEGNKSRRTSMEIELNEFQKQLFKLDDSIEGKTPDEIPENIKKKRENLIEKIKNIEDKIKSDPLLNISSMESLLEHIEGIRDALTEISTKADRDFILALRQRNPIATFIASMYLKSPFRKRIDIKKAKFVEEGNDVKIEGKVLEGGKWVVKRFKITDVFGTRPLSNAIREYKMLDYMSKLGFSFATGLTNSLQHIMAYPFALQSLGVKRAIKLAPYAIKAYTRILRSLKNEAIKREYYKQGLFTTLERIYEGETSRGGVLGAVMDASMIFLKATEYLNRAFTYELSKSFIKERAKRFGFEITSKEIKRLAQIGSDVVNYNYLPLHTEGVLSSPYGKLLFHLGSYPLKTMKLMAGLLKKEYQSPYVREFIRITEAGKDPMAYINKLPESGKKALLTYIMISSSMIIFSKMFLNIWLWQNDPRRQIFYNPFQNPLITDPFLLASGMLELPTNPERGSKKILKAISGKIPAYSQLKRVKRFMETGNVLDLLLSRMNLSEKEPPIQ